MLNDSSPSLRSSAAPATSCMARWAMACRRSKPLSSLAKADACRSPRTCSGRWTPIHAPPSLDPVTALRHWTMDIPIASYAHGDCLKSRRQGGVIHPRACRWLGGEVFHLLVGFFLPYRSSAINIQTSITIDIVDLLCRFWTTLHSLTPAPFLHQSYSCMLHASQLYDGNRYTAGSSN